MANAKKKASAKKKTSARPVVKKKTTSSKPAKKAASAKAKSKTKPSKAVAKKAVAKKAPAKKAAPKPPPKAIAKKAIIKKAAPKPVAKTPPAVLKAAPKPPPAKPAAKKPELPKVAAPAAAPTPAAVQSKAVKKDPSPRKKASETPPRQIARAVTAVAKSPNHDHSIPAVRTRMINLDEVKLPAGYVPKANEEYMSPVQLLYFRNKLKNWRDELITESQETLDHLRSEIRDVGDEAERASRESDNILELRTRDRYRKLLKKVDDAIKRIDDGSYGFCEETGEEIGLARLEARPIATLTVDAQERRELFQKQFRDDR